MNSTVHNVQRVTLDILAEGEGLVRALTDEMAQLAQEAVRFMKNRAPKWRSTLTNSIHAEMVDPTS